MTSRHAPTMGDFAALLMSRGCDDRPKVVMVVDESHQALGAGRPNAVAEFARAARKHSVGGVRRDCQ